MDPRGAARSAGAIRINLRVAQLYAARGRCSSARLYARRARGLFRTRGGESAACNGVDDYEVPASPTQAHCESIGQQKLNRGATT